MECSKCGNESEPSHLFCSACGEQLQASPAGPAPGSGPGAYPFYPPPGYAMPVATLQKTEGMFVVALVLGIISVTNLLGVIFGPLAIIFYYRGKARLKADPTLGGSGMGLAGLITGIVGTTLSCITWPLFIYLLTSSPH
jgi:hypothetical protein